MWTHKLLGTWMSLALCTGLAFGQANRARFGTVIPVESGPIQRTSHMESAPAIHQMAGQDLPPASVVPPEEVVGPLPVVSPATHAYLVNPYLRPPHASRHPGPAEFIPAEPCNPGPVFWIQGEYLRWHLDGYRLPALLTQSPPGISLPLAGTLADPSTQILFGNETVQEGWYSGFRIGAGLYLTADTHYALEANGFLLPRQTDRFTATSTGIPGLFRPFFNTTLGRPDAALVAFVDPDLNPGVLTPVASGSFTAENSTQFGGVGFDLRSNLWRDGPNRLDWLLGYRYLSLQDRIVLNQQTVTTGGLQPVGTQLRVNDFFDTNNHFNGVNLGFKGEMEFGRLFVQGLAQVALGQTRRVTIIEGGRLILAPDGSAVTVAGGLLAQRTNMGRYIQNDFAAIPEVGLNVGYQILPGFRIYGGYTALYWPNVSRAGGQIDAFLSQVPPTGPTALARPSYPGQEDSLFVHGFNAGVEIRY